MTSSKVTHAPPQPGQWGRGGRAATLCATTYALAKLARDGEQPTCEKCQSRLYKLGRGGVVSGESG